jgi:hypothetical protein
LHPQDGAKIAKNLPIFRNLCFNYTKKEEKLNALLCSNKVCYVTNQTRAGGPLSKF